MGTRSLTTIIDTTNTDREYLHLCNGYDGYLDGVGNELTEILIKFINSYEFKNMSRFYIYKIQQFSNFLPRAYSEYLEYNSKDLIPLYDIEYWYKIEINKDIISLSYISNGLLKHKNILSTNFKPLITFTIQDSNIEIKTFNAFRNKKINMLLK
jgi:hypothetical protein